MFLFHRDQIPLWFAVILMITVIVKSRQGVELTVPEIPPLATGIVASIAIPVTYTGASTLKYSVSPEITGLSYGSSGTIYYDGSNQIPEHVTITVRATDGNASDKIKVSLSIPRSPAVTLTRDGEDFVVDGQTIRFRVLHAPSGSDFNVSFAGLDHFPEPPVGVKRLSPNFVVTSTTPDLSVATLWPIDLLEKRGEATRATIFVFIPGRGWINRSSFAVPKFIGDEEWFMLESVLHGKAAFVGLRPDRSDPSKPVLDPASLRGSKRQ